MRKVIPFSYLTLPPVARNPLTVKRLRRLAGSRRGGEGYEAARPPWARSRG